MPRTQPLLHRHLHRLSNLRLTLHQVEDHAVCRLVADDGEDDFTYGLSGLGTPSVSVHDGWRTEEEEEEGREKRERTTHDPAELRYP